VAGYPIGKPIKLVTYSTNYIKSNIEWNSNRMQQCDCNHTEVFQ